MSGNKTPLLFGVSLLSQALTGVPFPHHYPFGIAICSSMLSTEGNCHTQSINWFPHSTIRIQQVAEGDGYHFQVYHNDDQIVDERIKSPQKIRSAVLFAAIQARVIAYAVLKNIVFNNWRWGKLRYYIFFNHT